jgi:hypothetical protein
MKRSLVIIVSGCLAALVLGLVVAYPLFVSSFPSLSKPDLSVDVSYAFIQPIGSNSTLAGFWWNESVVEVNYSGGVPGGTIKADGIVVSYLIVLNVTNNSNESARIRNFDIIVGPQVSVGDGGSVFAGNPVLTDSRHFTYLSVSDNEVWDPHSSKLIGLSGITGVHEVPYASLNESAIYLYGSAEGQVAYGNPSQDAKGYRLKQVQLQNVENAYLYNDLLNENQVLLFYSGLTMSIGTRR